MPAVVSLAGDWDIFSRDTLRNRLTPAHTADRCIIDFTDCVLGDASFLTELIFVSKIRRTHGLPPLVLVITPNNPVLQRILEVTQLARLWPVYDSVDAAIRATANQTLSSPP